MRYLRFVLTVLLLGPMSGSVLSGTPTADFRPDPKSVLRYGPAYRYPHAGWIVLHIEGEPYDRGYQHGRLLAPEIAAYVRCFAAIRSPNAPADGWKHTRALVNALFLRRYDKEYLEEMKGIADGASAAGARFNNKPIDLVDVVALNAWMEVATLDSALEATPNGLEGKRFPKEPAKAKPPTQPMRCSAFAATGKATRDGKVVFGHITMFSLYPSNFYNVWLDVKPAKGHRVIMQTYPAGIQSGLDYYMNDAGILVCETTIRQTNFDIKGAALASRIRQALQYADSIDKAVVILGKDNNGLYTNEWLLADVKTNEIAMFELGTHKSRLRRSSKNEWYGGTEGFYWGCNNTKDLQVRLETLASTDGRPANVVFRPSDRDLVWLKLYHAHKGKIDADFGKLAFTTPPVAAYHSLDAKFTTTDMAKELKSWALFGPPLGRTWEPTFEQRKRYPEIEPLVSNPWAVLHVGPPAKDDKKGPLVVDLRGLRAKERYDKAMKEREERDAAPSKAAWHGTLLPKTDADVWLAAAFADYERIYAREKQLTQDGKLSKADREQLAVDLFACRSKHLAAARVNGDVPLAKIRATAERDEWYRIASGKGVLLLHQLRKLIGDDRFADMMDAFGRAHAGKEATAAEFQTHVAKYAKGDCSAFFNAWLAGTGLPQAAKNGEGQKTNGGVFSVLSFQAERDQTLIVYGTADEIHTNREAAEALQKAIIEQWSNITVPIKADKDVTDADLKNRHLLLIGRPDTNKCVERFRAKLPVTFGSRSFTVMNECYAHANSAVMAAAENPLNPRYSMVVIAGLGAASTLRAGPALVNVRPGEVVVWANGAKPRALVLAE
jgi:hypothetical protein